MASFETDTEIKMGHSDGLCFANLSRRWEIWGPNGGYLAAIALRAVGKFCKDFYPASFYCQYLNAAEFGEVDIRVTNTKTGKSVTTFKVDVDQADKLILTALICLTKDCPGYQHSHVKRPDSWCDIHHAQEDTGEAAKSYAFWNNFAIKPAPVALENGFPSDRPTDYASAWYRFLPDIDLSDPFIDAARSLVLIDTLQWPAVYHMYGPRHIPYIAPSLDLSVQFHQPGSSSSWLFCNAHANLANRGLVAGEGTIWSENGEIIASGRSQLLCRQVKK